MRTLNLTHMSYFIKYNLKLTRRLTAMKCSTAVSCVKYGVTVHFRRLALSPSSCQLVGAVSNKLDSNAIVARLTARERFTGVTSKSVWNWPGVPCLSRSRCFSKWPQLCNCVVKLRHSSLKGRAGCTNSDGEVTKWVFRKTVCPWSFIK
jgi:hypothetical protein